MPAPLMHIALALIALAGPFSRFDKKNFIVGTSFPDIRYPAGIPRNQTHARPVLWNQKNLTAFQAGYLFHSWVDLLFEEYTNETGLMRRLPPIPYALQTLKIMADKKLYHMSKQVFGDIPACFKTIIPEERVPGVKLHLVREWHKKLTRYAAGHCFHPDGDFCLAKSDNATLAKISAILAVTGEENDLVEQVTHDFYRFTSQKIDTIRLPEAGK